MGAAVSASETVTFFRRKPGHLLLPGRLHCGPVEVADIGIPDSGAGAASGRSIFANAPALWADAFRCRSPTATNIARGHAVVVSGDLSHTGAARLAARGALRAGAGLVTIASPRDALAVNAASNLAVMVRAGRRRGGACGVAGRSAAQRGRARARAAASGPPMREWCWRRLSGERAVVLDADALTSFADDARSAVCRDQVARCRRRRC